MKIEKRDGGDEKTVLIGMIVDDRVCGRIASKWQNGLFRSKWSNLIGGWCVRHYERYGHAPSRKIQHSFERWAEKAHDDSTVNLVEKFLSGLSDEWAEMKRESNSDYVLDVAGRHFALVQMEKLKNDLEDRIADKDADKAVELIETHRRVNLGSSEWIDPFQDRHAIQKAFDDVGQPLIRYGGALGKFFGDRLERDGLICFEGPEKRGKTFVLMDLVFRSVEQRRKTAYYQVGDMSQNQIMRRLMVRMAGVPLKSGKYEVPIKLTVKDEQKEGRTLRIPKVITKTVTFEEGLDWRTAQRACKEFQRKSVKSLDHYLRMKVMNINTVKACDIHNDLTEWARDGWVVDTLIIDYADILNMNYPGIEGRDRINQTWMDLRQLSEDFHCLVATASQTNRASYSAYTMKKEHASEEKRKRSHSTGNVGLNQTEAEKQIGVMRFNWIQLREGAYFESKCVFVAGCPALGNLMMRSSF